MSAWWSWALTAVGLTCFWLAGRKVWWAWFVGLAGQILWLAYSLVTGQVGFLVGVAAYTAVYSKNAYLWTRQRASVAPPDFRSRVADLLAYLHLHIGRYEWKVLTTEQKELMADLIDEKHRREEGREFEPIDRWWRS